MTKSMTTKLMTIALTAGLLSGCASYDAVHRYDASDAQMDQAVASAQRICAEEDVKTKQAIADSLEADADYRATADRVFAHQPVQRQLAQDALPPATPHVGNDSDIARDEFLIWQQQNFDQDNEGLLRAQLGLDD